MREGGESPQAVIAMFGAMSIPSPQAGGAAVDGPWRDGVDAESIDRDGVSLSDAYSQNGHMLNTSTATQEQPHAAVRYGDTGLVMEGGSEVEYDDELAYLLQRNSLDGNEESPMDFSLSYIS